MSDIDWIKFDRAGYARIQYFDKDDKAVGFQRVERQQQTKTVADAYEWANKKWHGGKSNAIAYNPNSDYFSYCEGEDLNHNWYLVCTREQFEAYAKEQEGEKWTHRTNAGELCNIHVKEPDVNGVIIVINERGEYLRHNSDSLKPIKQTLTKAEAWDLLMARKTNSAEVNTIKQQYDII